MRKINRILMMFCAVLFVLLCSACGRTGQSDVPGSPSYGKTDQSDMPESPSGEGRKKTAESAASLESWKEGDAKERIVEFVEDATDPDSIGYIPPEDRIAVTDIDGTLIAEKGDKVDNKAMVKKAPEEARDYLLDIQDDYFDRDKELLYRGILYQPMAEMYDYLKDNGFDIFFVSGNCNSLTYAWANYFFGAEYSRCIGSNVELEIDDSDGFRMKPNGKYEECWKEKKCYRIYNQIGKCPVLAFGNSDGDVRMLEWTQANPEYPGLSVMIIHDDSREYIYSVDAISHSCEKHQFVKAEMSKSFKKIFSE